MFDNAIEFLDHWQVLIAGILGLAAAIIAVFLTLGSERRKRKHELSMLGRSLGMEVRQFMANAYKAHLACRELLTGDKAAAIPAIMVEDKAKLPASAIYPHAAARIAEFGDGAEHIVLFFNKIAVVREAAERLTRHPSLDNLPHDEIAAAAEALIQIANTGLLL